MGIFSPIVANAATSVGSDVTVATTTSTTVNVNSLLTDTMTATGFPADMNVLAVLSTTIGTLQETATAGLTLPTGYQSSLTTAGTTIAFAGLPAAVNAALATVQLTTPVYGGQAAISLSVTARGSNNVAYNPANGHYYEYVSSPVTWDGAFNAITGASLLDQSTVYDTSTRMSTPSASCPKTFNGMCGYFATVSTASENDFITSKVGVASAWLGGTDRKYEGVWKWADPRSPEYDKQFSDQSSSAPSRLDQTGLTHSGAGTHATGQPIAYTVGGTTYSYVNWNTSEPNNSLNNENALQILSGGGGQWNDLLENSTTMGYVVEYGGNGETLQYPTASRTITVNIPIPAPTFGTPTSAAHGFTATISNYSASYSYETVTVSAGSVSRSGSTITVSGLSPSQSATITMVAKNGTATSPNGSVTGIALAPYVAPTDYSLSFDGISQFDSTTAQVIPATGPFTVEAWVNPSEGSNTNSRTIISQGDTVGASGNRFYMKRYNGQLWYYVDGQAAENKCGLIPQGQWTHIAVTVISSQAICYLNGIAQVTTAVSGAHAIGNKFQVGGYAASVSAAAAGVNVANTKFVGKIDEVKVWNVARLAADIVATKDAAPTLSASNLRAYYDFNAGAGLWVQNTASGADAVAGSNLAILGSPSWTDNNSQQVVGGSTVTTFNRSYITSAGGWTAPSGVTSIDVLVVGGGGGGGQDGGSGGAGGGAYVATGVTISDGALLGVKVATGGNAGIYNVVPDTTPVISVANSAGGSSVLTIGSTIFTANGGAAGNGGVSGSAAAAVSGGTATGTGGTATQGASGGGGQGWGRGGGLGLPGGAGTFTNNWLGSTRTYGGGGGGGSERAGAYLSAVAVVSGGAGGGGNAGGLVSGTYVAATSGAVGTGGGGGGGLSYSASQLGKSSAAGGSGIAMIRYSAPMFSSTTPTFGNQNIGTTSAPQSVVVTNVGSAPMIFGAAAVTLAGLNSSEFSITSDTCSSATLAVNETCTATVTFSPTAVGTRVAVLQFTNNAYGNTQLVNLIGTAGVAPLVVTAPTASANYTGTTGTAFTLSIAATGGSSPLEYDVTTGVLPDGLSMDDAGNITGSPTTAGTYTVSFTVTDSLGTAVVVNSVTFTISAPPAPAPSYTPPPAPTVTPSTIPPITGGTSMNFQVPATGGTNFNVSGGSLPAGLTLNPSTGLISGTPTSSGPYSFTITVTNSSGQTTTITYSGNITAPTTPTPTTGGSTGGTTSASGTGSGNTSGAGSTTSPAALPPITPPVVLYTATPVTTGSGSATSLTGNVSVLVDGVAVTANLKPNTAGDGYELTAPGWKLNLQPLDGAGNPVPLNGNSQIVLSSNRLVGVNGDGFLPNSIVNVYLFSTPTLLGTVMTDANGKFNANFPVAESIAVGNHVIQVNGFSPTKEVRSASVGLLVDSVANIAATTKISLVKIGSTGVVPFAQAKYKIGSVQTRVINSFKFAKNPKLQVIGYASNTIGQDDIRISLDRALEVKSALQRLYPKAVITALGGGTTNNRLCAKYENRCVVVRVTK